MPSNRSVLADVTDLGLDPREHHRSTNASGRLKVTRTTTVESQSEPEVVEEVKVDSVVETKVEEKPAESVSEVVAEVAPPVVEDKKPKKAKKSVDPTPDQSS